MRATPPTAVMSDPVITMKLNKANQYPLTVKFPPMSCFWSFVTFVTDLRLSRVHKKSNIFRLSDPRLKFKARTLAGVSGREAGSGVNYEVLISGTFRNVSGRSVEARHTGYWLHAAL